MDFSNYIEVQKCMGIYKDDKTAYKMWCESELKGLEAVAKNERIERMLHGDK